MFVAVIARYYLNKCYFSACTLDGYPVYISYDINWLDTGENMVPIFVEVDRETQFLLPPSAQDWLPKDHLARFVVDVVEQLDLRSLKE